MSFQKIVSFDGRYIKLLLDKNQSEEKNAYTIITGKNAVGKSRLLSHLITQHFAPKNNRDYSLGSYQKIIAVTNLSVDKFPTIKKTKNIKYVCFNSELSRSPSFEQGFLKAIFGGGVNYNSLFSTFKYLNFSSELSFGMYSENTNFYKGKKDNLIKKSYMLYRMLESNQNLLKIHSNHFPFLSSMHLEPPLPEKVFMEKLAKEHDVSYDEIKLYDFALAEEVFNHWNILEKSEKFFINFLLSYENYEFLDLHPHYEGAIKNIIAFIVRNINPNSTSNLLSTHTINLSQLSKHKKDPIIFLIKNNILSIKNLTFTLNNNTKFNYSQLSSGQQSILKIFINIATQIQDYSLICIDEPELSLHPKWQTEFILKLQEIFSDFSFCHFVIATHSPQIVSGLKSPNGFIVDLEKNETYDAQEYMHKSADYQLAQVFNAPGYNNEYILKMCFHLLSVIKNKEQTTETDKLFITELKRFQKLLKEDDMSLYLVKNVLSLLEPEVC